MAHQIRQVCHGVMAALPLADIIARPWSSDLRRLRHPRPGINPHVPIHPHADRAEHVDHPSQHILLPYQRGIEARHDPLSTRAHRLGHGSNTSRGENVRVTKGLQIGAVVTASVLLAAACSSKKSSTASPTSSSAAAPTTSAPAATAPAASTPAVASTPAASTAPAASGGTIGLDFPRSDT